jgi:hypothetical protein
LMCLPHWTEFVDMTTIDPEQHKSLLDESELKLSFCCHRIRSVLIPAPY